MAQQLAGKTIPLRAIILSWEDVKKIYERLAKEVEADGDRRVAGLPKPPGKEDEEFERERKELRERAFRVTVTVTGSEGERLFGDDATIFDSPNLPHVVASVFMTNIVAFQNTASQRPINAFELTLDFSKPPLLDSDNPVSSPTPNSSCLKIEGDSEAWVAAVSAAVVGITERHETRRKWIHRAFAYDFGLILVGLPASFFVAYRMAGPIENYLGSTHTVISGAAYVYIVLFTIWAYRFFFGYTRWAFPSVELENPNDSARKHRGFWYLIIVALIAETLWTLLK